jgi:hypothetical protein
MLVRLPEQLQRALSPPPPLFGGDPCPGPWEQTTLFEVQSRSVTLPTHTREEAVVRRAALDLLGQAMPVSLRLMGVRMSGFAGEEAAAVDRCAGLGVCVRACARACVCMCACVCSRLEPLCRHVSAHRLVHAPPLFAPFVLPCLLRAASSAAWTLSCVGPTPRQLPPRPLPPSRTVAARRSSSYLTTTTARTTMPATWTTMTASYVNLMGRRVGGVWATEATLGQQSAAGRCCTGCGLAPDRRQRPLAQPALTAGGVTCS